MTWRAARGKEVRAAGVSRGETAFGGRADPRFRLAAVGVAMTCGEGILCPRFEPSRPRTAAG